MIYAIAYLVVGVAFIGAGERYLGPSAISDNDELRIGMLVVLWPLAALVFAVGALGMAVKYLARRGNV
jgi:hypothetical protein